MREEMARKDAEVQNKEDQMNEMTKDYGDLMEIKVALDMEIAAYNKLLEGEEARLGLSPTSSPEMSPPRKRKRTLFEGEMTYTYQTIGVLHYLYCSTVLHYYFPVLQCNALQFENMESNAKLHYFFEKVAVQGLHYFF